MCTGEKARDIFCRRELLASAAFHTLPHLCTLFALYLSSWRQFQELSYMLLYFFRLIYGMHTYSQKESEQLTWLMYIRDSLASGPGELLLSSLGVFQHGQIESESLLCIFHTSCGCFLHLNFMGSSIVSALF